MSALKSSITVKGRGYIYMSSKDLLSIYHLLILSTLLILPTTIISSVFAQQIPSSSDDLQIISQNEIKNKNKCFPTYSVIGEVQNNGNDRADFVRITATFYDKHDQIIGTAFTFTSPPDIESGHKAPFKVFATQNDVKTLGKIDHYLPSVSSG